MAKRGRTRYVTRVKKAYGRRKGLFSGNLMNVAYGGFAGAVSPMIPKFLGKWTLPAAWFGAGYLLKKPGFFMLAGYEIGKTLTTGSIGTGNNNGVWE